MATRIPKCRGDATYALDARNALEYIRSRPEIVIPRALLGRGYRKSKRQLHLDGNKSLERIPSSGFSLTCKLPIASRWKAIERRF